MGKRILVTGGAGFIGSHLCKKLLEQNNEVICADNLFTGRKENVAGLLWHPGFKLVQHDVTKPFYLEVDQIYNLACPASPVHYQYDPIKTTKTSVLGALHLLGLAKKNKARILQASTSEVYGDPKVHPQPEGYYGNVNPIGPRACYDEGKRAAEALFFSYYQQHQVEIRILRIFNTYGPNMRMDDGRVVSNFIVQALQDKDITIYGDGMQTRSFCYVSDLVEGMVSLMEQGGLGLAGPFNIGNPSEITMAGLAERILGLTGSSSKVVHQKLPADDPIKRKPDISRIKEAIGWEPKVSLEQGLGETIAYFKKELKL
ncbi:MAG: SDR family oxidoreductase [Lachnospiraceae bacterium]|jgi:UDP-glucuronate decarboxylase|nr:SDR family oxidoreductase [Lachnospiraceae bacterium]